MPFLRTKVRVLDQKPAQPEPASRRKLQLGIYGGECSFTCAAAHSIGLTDAEVEFHYLPVADALLTALYARSVEKIVYPTENSTAGKVMPIDLTLKKCDLSLIEVLDEFDMVINHCLMTLEDVELREVRSVASHVQALQQTRANRVRLFGGDMPTQAHADTALAARDLREGRLDRTTAVIASERAAKLYGLKIRRETFQDLGERNLTTFRLVRLAA